MKRLLLLPIIALALFACQKNDPDDLFGGKTPSQRFEQSQAELRRELAKPENGWKLTYFTNDKKFGGFTFLMKFTPEGLVEMNSDIGLTSSSTTSKYEIQEGQGTMLVFTTKNYIHELSDAYTHMDLRGKGYEGEFQFIYYGKEGNKLKFRTQRKATEQYVYFEPATAEDWNNIHNTTTNVALPMITLRPFNFYFRVTTNAGNEDYDIFLYHRFLTLTSFSNPSKVLEVSLSPSANKLVFAKPLVVEGKTFREMALDSSGSLPRYFATVDGVSIEILAGNITEEHINNDYQNIGTKVTQFIFLTSPLGIQTANTYTSNTFIRNFLMINTNNYFARIDFSFSKTGKCEVVLFYAFPNMRNYSRRVYTYNYTLTDKRLYLTNPQFKEQTDENLWNDSTNVAILNASNRVFNNITTVATNGFYIKKLPLKLRYSNVIYLLQSSTYSNISFPVYVN